MGLGVGQTRRRRGGCGARGVRRCTTAIVSVKRSTGRAEGTRQRAIQSKAACHPIKDGEHGKEGKEEEGDEASLGMFAVPISEKMACASRKLEAQRMLLQTVEDYVAAKSGTYVYKTPEYATHDSGDSDDSFGGYGGGGEGGFAADFGEDLMNRPSFEDGDSDDSDPMGCDNDDY